MHRHCTYCEGHCIYIYICDIMIVAYSLQKQYCNNINELYICIYHFNWQRAKQTSLGKFKEYCFVYLL